MAIGEGLSTESSQPAELSAGEAYPSRADVPNWVQPESMQTYGLDADQPDDEAHITRGEN